MFWLPSDSVREADLVEGVLKHSTEETILELDSERLHVAFSLVPSTRDAWRRRVVGKLADGLFVSIEGCNLTHTTHHSTRCKTRMTFNVSGNVFLTNDEEMVLSGEVCANEAYVEITGLPEWFASALSRPDPSMPYTTGIPLDRNARVEAECDDSSDFNIGLDDGFELRIQNTLYWGSDGLFGLNVRQATIARIGTTSLVSADLMLKKAHPLVGLVRFLSGENCVVRSACLYRTDRALPEAYGGGPIGLRLLTNEQGHEFAGWGEMLFRWRDIQGHENKTIRNWYRLYAENRYALRLLERVVIQGESVEGGIVLMVGAMQALTSYKGEKQYEKFLKDLGLESWGIEVATIGKKISDLRNAPAHGRQLPTEADIVSTYRFVVAAMRVYFLKKMGFSSKQVFRIAIRHRGIREGLGLPQENCDAVSHNEMLKPGWIMEGSALERGAADDV